jgi:transposase
MYPPLRLRSLTAEETQAITKLTRAHTVAAQLVQRAQIIAAASHGQTIPQISAALGCDSTTVRKWVKRFAAHGLAGLNDAPRSGAPSRYTPQTKARVIELARTRPRDLGLPYSSWTFERLATYLHETLGVAMKKTRIFEILQDEGLRWRKQETWFGERLDPEFASKRGPSKRSAAPQTTPTS